MSACTIPGPGLTSFSSVRAGRKNSARLYLSGRDISTPEKWDCNPSQECGPVKKFILENHMFSESNLSS